MSLQPVKTIVNTGIPVFQNPDDMQLVQGGFTLDTTGLILNNSIAAGHPMYYDEATRKAKPVKCAELYANATNVATTYQVKKGHTFGIGDFMAFIVGGAAHTITAIDTSNALYDVITVDVTLGTVQVAGDVLFQSSAAGAAAGAVKDVAKGVLFSDTNIAVDEPLSVVVEAMVYERRVQKASSYAKANMPNIIYSQSK
jgi:hypothetical protein